MKHWNPPKIEENSREIIEKNNKKNKRIYSKNKEEGDTSEKQKTQLPPNTLFLFILVSK